mmetsp:Transcript_28694/g.52261  ORF Transcript_28694/g.52261 Transcript_28694/m.52261 type:complete len:292 (+) Transcript_28694:62-937(+)
MNAAGTVRRHSGLGPVNRSPLVVTVKNGQKNAAAGARVLNGSSHSQLAGPRCLQCMRSPAAGSSAHYADVQHRPVTTGKCEHGPFCDRCRARIAACTLPSCVCRALIRSWGETTWPEGSAITCGGASASRVVQPKSESLQKPQSGDTAAGGFFAWDSFHGNSKRSVSAVEGEAAGPALPPTKAAKETANIQHSNDSIISRGMPRLDSDVSMKNAVNGHTGGVTNGNALVHSQQMPPAKRMVSGPAADDLQPAKTKQKTTVNDFAKEAALLAARRRKPQGTRTQDATSLAKN